MTIDIPDKMRPDAKKALRAVRDCGVIRSKWTVGYAHLVNMGLVDFRNAGNGKYDFSLACADERASSVMAWL